MSYKTTPHGLFLHCYFLQYNVMVLHVHLHSVVKYNIANWHEINRTLIHPNSS